MLPRATENAMAYHMQTAGLWY